MREPYAEKYPHLIFIKYMLLIVLRYKGMAVCLVILQRALCGNYVNFGVFALYGDMALSNALGIALKLALTFPLEEMLVRVGALLPCVLTTT